MNAATHMFVLPYSTWAMVCGQATPAMINGHVQGAGRSRTIP